MVREQAILDIVINEVRKLDINNSNYEGIRPKLKEQLIKAEYYIQYNIQKQKEIANEIKNNKLNILNVAEKAGIPRSSIYKSKEILEKYIEGRIEQVQKEDILSLHKLSRQKKSIDELNEFIEKVQIHLIETEILEYKINELEQQVKSLNITNQDLISREYRAQQEIERLKLQLRKAGVTNIVNFKDKT
ncbi:uncharacterized small protein (DUF1192 family) [Lysinibacillus composti]|uniref:Uncharacterized protein n=1 Tax=Lysinibacillus composti TaxID=720633 RepID=A0A3N9UJS9_9BACI|nr:hypothetical protein [Lysinibacillus composti]MBM7607248.1 uncharacterized small protein (DUF1192 family) [Lysinibacillus composti]RQW76175.1 hypothetical protein EBB45_01090 [Lysinibacillus composti]